MRRLFLLAATLVLLGLSTAFAASFGTQSEDAKSFSSAVSISVPPNPVQAFFLSGDHDHPPGGLSLVSAHSNVESFEIHKDTETVQAQDDHENYFVWQTATVAGSPLSLAGPTRLFIDQKGESGSRLTAGLFNCPAGAAITSTAATGCVQIGASAIGPVPGSGYNEITVDFGTLPSTTIPVGNQLRLKIVNRDTDGAGNTISTKNFKVAWGFSPARESQLVFGP